MSSMKRLLCIVYEPGNFHVWIKLAARAQKTSDFDLILWSPYCLPESARYQAEAMAAGSVFVEEATSAGGLADIFTRLSGWLSPKPIRLSLDLQAKVSGQELPPVPSNVRIVANALVSELPEPDRYAIWCEVDRIQRRISFCEDWLVRLGIDAVVLAEDNVERDSYGWIAGAKRRGIRTVVSSYGAISDQEAVSAYRGSASHAVSANQARLIRQYIPQWLAEGDGFAISRLPFSEAIARELTGTAPFNPWLVNTGHADVIALESAAMKQAYLKFGISDAKLKPIGHPLQDSLAVVSRERLDRRATLFAQHNLSADRPLAVVAMPPNQLASRTCVYREYAEVISAFARLPGVLAGVNVVVSPHPNISAEGRALIRSTGVALVETTVADLLPLADLYISSVSSTIKWALGCGIPVIDFDCYGYGYSDYLNLPQVMSASNETEFRSALLRYGNHEKRAQLVALARSGAEHWGKFDGRATDRLVELMLEVGANVT
jgi:hypothetical protein